MAGRPLPRPAGPHRRDARPTRTRAILSGARIDLDRFFALLAEVPVPPDAEALWDPATPPGAIRLANLRRYLHLVSGADTALIAEAPGWRGATVTGVPFFSMRELTARPGLLTGDPAGDGFAVPAAPAAAWEASSAVVAASLARWGRPLPVSWPVVPHHPFQAGNRASNRTPRPAEVRAGIAVTLELLAAFRIRRVVAGGRKAEGALAAAGVTAIPVRHPAQGGAALFAAGLARLAPG
ncbi:MAG: hypothetical protein ACTHJL_00135 [Amnibacterium sp.]